MAERYSAQYFFEKHMDEVKREYDVEGLNEILDEYETLKDSELYKRIVESFILDPQKIRDTDVLLSEEEKEERMLLKVAKTILKDPPRIYFLRKDMITLLDVYAMHRLIEIIYYVNVGMKLTQEDVLKYTQSGLDEQIVLELEQFDKNTKTNSISEKFFNKLKNIEWKDKNSKKLYNKLEKIRKDGLSSIFQPISSKHSVFSATESYFLLFLSACSAVNNNREEINMYDVITAYKTYFKLLKTDLPSLIEKLEQGVDE